MDAATGGFHAETQTQAPAQTLPLPLLLKAARACGLQARRDDVQRALNDAQNGADFAEWATTHLVSDTFLSADELALYSALDTSGQVDKLASLYDLSNVQAIQEDDLRRAIQDLRQSTDTVAEQSKTLRQQHHSLSQLVEKKSHAISQRRQLEHAATRQVEAERKQLAIEVDQLSHNVALRIANLEQQLSQDDTNLETLIHDAFSSDDKLLAGLQKLDGELDPQDADEAAAVDELRESCQQLINVTVETVKDMLDATYLDTLVTAQRSGCAQPATQDQVKVAMEEVESLYTDISSVAQMSVDQQYLEPAIKSVTAKSNERLSRTKMALDYMDECLLYLGDRVARFLACVETHKSFQALTATIVSTAKAELAVDVSRPDNPAAMDAPVSPTRKPALPQMDAVSTPRARRSSAAGSTPPLDMLVEKLGLQMPSRTSSPQARMAVLASALEQRNRKVAEIERGAHESFEQAVKMHLHDVHGAVQLLRDSVLAESPFGKVELVDGEVEESIHALRSEVLKAKKRLRLVQEQKLVAHSDTKEELLQRFGSGVD